MAVGSQTESNWRSANAGRAVQGKSLMLRRRRAVWIWRMKKRRKSGRADGPTAMILRCGGKARMHGAMVCDPVDRRGCAGERRLRPVPFRVPHQAQPQLRAGAQQSRFGRRDCNPELIGHIRHRQFFDIAEKHHIPQDRRNAPDLRSQDLLHLSVCEFAFGIGAARGQFDWWGVVNVRRLVEIYEFRPPSDPQ